MKVYCYLLSQRFHLLNCSAPRRWTATVLRGTVTNHILYIHGDTKKYSHLFKGLRR